MLPYAESLFAEIRRLGMIGVYHSDGNVATLLESIMALGAHALQSIDPMAGMDIKQVKQQTQGRLALLGNVQCNLLQEGPEAAIRRIARYCLTHASPGSGYVFMASNSIFAGMPLANYHVMQDEYGRFVAQCATSDSSERHPAGHPRPGTRNHRRSPVIAQMNSQSPPSEQSARQTRWLTPTTLGTLYCGLSALAYGLMGICQRQVATSCDPVLVNWVQASVSTTIFGVYLLVRSLRGRSAWPPLTEMMALIGIGLVTQLGGVAYQWSIGVIGLAIANPLQMGVMLAGSATLGFLVLGEKASWRCITAIVLITAAVLLLSLGAEQGNSAIVATGQATEESAGSASSPLKKGTGSEPRSEKTRDNNGREVPVPLFQQAASSPEMVARESSKPPGRMLWPLLGVAAGIFCGLAFAVLTVGVRKLVTGATSPEATVFFISCAGTVCLGPWTVQRLSLDAILATPAGDWLAMLAFGGFNLLAFFLFAKGLRAPLPLFGQTSSTTVWPPRSRCWPASWSLPNRPAGNSF